jgi:hypothetical protein
MPFSEQALGSFVFYERPEGMEYDAPELELASEVIAPLTPGGVVVPYEQEFATVGHLYRGIEQGGASREASVMHTTATPAPNGAAKASPKRAPEPMVVAA